MEIWKYNNNNNYYNNKAHETKCHAHQQLLARSLQVPSRCVFYGGTALLASKQLGRLHLFHYFSCRTIPPFETNIISNTSLFVDFFIFFFGQP